MSSQLLVERLTHNDAQIKIEESVDKEDNSKSYYMEGIFIQGDVRNHNGRIYPRHEIESAVSHINEKIGTGVSVLGEVDHPPNLQINLDRVSHMITEMKMDGSNGVGKLKIIPTEMGNLIKTFLENGVKLGVSSRGTGEVGPDQRVRNFEIVTVDIVAQPSAPEAYPEPILEALEHYKRRGYIVDLSESIKHDSSAQKYLEREITKFIKTLNL